MLEKLREIIWDYTNDRSLVIEPDTVLLGDIGLNSYEMVEIVCSVEEEFDIEIPDRVLATFKTVQDVLDYIEEEAE